MKIWSLQALRFFAALGVVVYHADSVIFNSVHKVGVLGARGAMFGQFGVDIFFVLSGVIIALTSKGLTARAFAARRATRILPLYLAVTAVYLAAGALAGTLGWREAATSLTLWPALDRMTDPVVPVAWTLCFEALFYAAAALVLWKPRLAWPLGAIFLSALALRSDPVTRFVGNPIILEFLMGVAIAHAPRRRVIVGLIPLGLALAWFSVSRDYPTAMGALEDGMVWRRVLGFGAPAAMVVWGAMQIPARQSLLTYLGETSYSLYLVHTPVVLGGVWLLARFTALPADAMALAVAAASILMGWRVHELVEKPMLTWLRRPSSQFAPA